MNSPESRVAIVTGGSSGIGKSVAVALARQGYAVVIIGSTAGRVRSAADELSSISNGAGKILGLRLDVTNESDMNRMAATTLERFGRIDVLVASAGIGKTQNFQRAIPYPTHELPLEEWRGVLSVNLTGAFLANRAVLPAMLRQHAGHIVNIGSSTTPYGLRGTAFAPAYCASKFALVGFSESLATEVADAGVRVQLVFPGPISTPLIDQTALGRPFGGVVAAESFADAVTALLKVPLDTIVVHPHVLPSAPKRAAGRTITRQRPRRS